MWRCFDPLPVLLSKDKTPPEAEKKKMRAESEDDEDKVKKLLEVGQADSSK
jgi:hypothetical protein